MSMIELTSGELSIPQTGKIAVVFHLPGHCAGCKRVVESLKQRPCDGWTIILVNAEKEEFKSLVESYTIQTAPTIITYKDGCLDNAIVGLKEFLACADNTFGPLAH